MVLLLEKYKLLRHMLIPILQQKELITQILLWRPLSLRELLKLNKYNKIRLFKGRSSKGVKGMSLKNNDKVISLSILNKNLISSNKDEMKSKEEFILTITENGYGKRSSSYEFRETGRGGQGIINISTSERNGNVSASFPINAEDF